MRCVFFLFTTSHQFVHWMIRRMFCCSRRLQQLQQQWNYTFPTERFSFCLGVLCILCVVFIISFECIYIALCVFYFRCMARGLAIAKIAHHKKDSFVYMHNMQLQNDIHGRQSIYSLSLATTHGGIRNELNRSSMLEMKRDPNNAHIIGTTSVREAFLVYAQRLRATEKRNNNCKHK